MSCRRFPLLICCKPRARQTFLSWMGALSGDFDPEEPFDLGLQDRLEHFADLLPAEHLEGAREIFTRRLGLQKVRENNNVAADADPIGRGVRFGRPGDHPKPRKPALARALFRQMRWVSSRGITREATVESRNRKWPRPKFPLPRPSLPLLYWSNC
jgi:hypothetical protein